MTRRVAPHLPLARALTVRDPLGCAQAILAGSVLSCEGRHISEEILRRLEDAVMVGEAREAAELIRRTLDQGLNPLVLIDEALTPSMNRIGTGSYGPSLGAP